MKQHLKFLLGLVLVLMFAASAVFSVGVSLLTVKDAMRSGGSLERFEAHLRHYSDRLQMDENGLRLIRASHPFVLHFGMLTLSWILTIGCAAGLRYL